MVRKFSHKLLLISLGLLGITFGASAQSQVFSSEQIEVELIAETTNVVPGETLWLAIRLDPIEHWHTYWKFGGDSGEATAASEWQLPAGAEAGDILWPTPEWTPFEGTDLVTFAYEREVFLPIPVSVPDDLDVDQFEISTTIDWQVCDVICIPGQSDFSLTLPVDTQSQLDSQWQQAFADTRASLPVAEHNLLSQFNIHDGKVNIMVDAGEDLFVDVEEAFFFTEQGRIMKYAPYRRNLVEPDRLQISFEQHRRMPADIAELRGVLAVADEVGNWRSFEITPQKTQVAWNNSIELELLAEAATIVPGEQTWLGIRLEAIEGWHTYWKFGGDSGEPTRAIDWVAPEGTVVGDISWPAPHWLPFPGSSLVNYAYEGEVLLPLPVTVPETVQDETVTLSTLVEYQVCELICIPGEQRLDITLPVADVAELDIANEAIFARTRAEIPLTEHDIESIIVAAGERVSLGFQAGETRFNDVVDAWFFPDRRRVIANGPVRDVTIQPNLIQITHQQPRRMLEDLSEVYGTLVTEDGQGNRVAYDFLDPAADANEFTITPLAAASEGSSTGGSATPLVVLGFMFGAMLGGLILNLMPCVFPVLSLKALAFASNAGASAQKQRMDGMVYTSGVVVSFLLLGALLIALRAAGEAIGWGFQLQSPWFIALIIYLFFVMGLSLSGVFEFGTSLMNVGNELADHSHGHRRSFFTGVLAVVVATPCTAPLGMGPALGFALTQSWMVAMLVFAALGLGMALPILVLSFLPALVRYMPKPGNWMVTFKEFMAFPMYGTALFFLWVLGNQVGITGMSIVLAACVLLAFASWLIKKRQVATPFWRYANASVAAICLVIALFALQTPFLTPVASTAVSLDEDGNVIQDFEPFSTARLDNLQAAGRPVFVNMTAAWCITCLANEQTTLSTDVVRQAMEDNDITYMKGDWTNEDPEITAILDQFNRPSVPLYVLYPADQSKEPTILPQILTPSIMLEAFQEI